MIKFDKNIKFRGQGCPPYGTGSTADAVRYELKTGNKVGGKNHLQKAQDSIKALEKWIKNNPNANKSDIDTAQKYIKDLNNALNGN